MTLGLVAWISAIATLTSPAVVSVTWLGNQLQEFVDNIALDRVIVDAERRKALAQADAMEAQLPTDIAASIAKDDAWLASHPTSR